MVSTFPPPGCDCPGCHTGHALRTRATFTRQEVSTLIALAMRSGAADTQEDRQRAWGDGWSAGYAACRADSVEATLDALARQPTEQPGSRTGLGLRTLDAIDIRRQWDMQAKADYAADRVER